MQTTFSTRSSSARSAVLRQIVAASLFGALMLAPVAGFVLATDFTARGHDRIALSTQGANTYPLCRAGEIGCVTHQSGRSLTFSNR